ncbi:MAG: TonB-dependent receptor [Sphingomonadales bacterium]|nr:TonB-dependent receptor [Sphingomonadales bacterium]
MKLQFQVSAGAIALALATGYAAPAMAQAQADSGAGTGDIIVTAQRIEQRLQDVPISMTVLDANAVANRNITVANDLATYTPSLSSNERYGPEKQSFSLRGFNQDQSTAPTVGVYFADVVGVRAQGGTTSGNSVGAGAFMDLANVQVLKGPQGTLFGRNTTGGAILLVPKKPNSKLEGYVEGSLGNYNLRRIQAAVNIPLSDTFKIRFSADRMKRDGYMKNKATTAGATADFNDRNYEAYRLSIVGNLTPDLENYTIFSYSNSHTHGYASKIAGCQTNMAVLSGTGRLTAQGCQVSLGAATARGDTAYDVDTSVLNPYLQIKQFQIINTTTWTASDHLTVKNIASYGEFKEDTHFDLYSSNLVVGPNGFDLRQVSPQLPFTLPAGTVFKYIDLGDIPGQSASHERTFTEELQFQGTVGDKFNYVVGGYLEFARPLGYNAQRTGIYLNCTDPGVFACANPLFFGSVSESRTQLSFNNHGIYAQGTYKATDKLSLTAGIRYTFDNVFGNTISTRDGLDPAGRNPLSFVDPATGVRIAMQCTDSFRKGNGYVANNTLCRTDLANPSKAPTWVLNADYKITPDNMLYAKWARGYRQGGLNFTNPGLETWKPEHMDTFEIGSKNTFRGAVSGYLNVSAFLNKLRDMQVFAGLTASSQFPGVAGGAAIINAGKATSYGLEIDGSASIMDGQFRLDFGYAYLHTKIDALQDQPTLNALTKGTPFDATWVVGDAVNNPNNYTPGKITPTVQVGSAFTLAPKHKLTATGTWTLPLPEKVGKIAASLTMVYTGEQIANGSVPAYFGTGTSILGLGGGYLPAHTLLNVNVNWNHVAGSPVDAAFFATNVTGKVYAVNTGGGWNSSGIGDLLIGEPRMYGVKLKVSY